MDMLVHASLFVLTKILAVRYKENPTDKAVGFLSSVRFLGAHRKYAHRIHTFRKSAYAQIGVHGGKTWFPLCERVSKTCSRKALGSRKSFRADENPCRD